MHYLYLSIAVVAEVVGTSALKASGEFTRVVPSLVTLAGFILSFCFLALSLRMIPVGIAYALWSGLGIILVTLVGWLFNKEAVDLPGIAGLALIVAGCVTIHMFSKASAA